MCGLSPLASFYFIIIIIIVVVVVVDDDTNYWVYLSSDHLFQVYYKVRQVLLQSATGITKCDNFITKCDSTNVLLVGMSSLLIATDKRDYFYQK